MHTNACKLSTDIMRKVADRSIYTYLKWDHFPQQYDDGSDNSFFAANTALFHP